MRKRRGRGAVEWLDTPLGAALRRLCLALVRFCLWLLVDLRVEGQGHLPAAEPLLVVSNHFSLFEPPLLALHLPRVPHFLVAVETVRELPIGLLVTLFDQIPVQRGQVDRAALRRALELLRRGDWIGIFPEGGIDPELVARLGRGASVAGYVGQRSRPGAQLIPARPGAAYLALQSQVRLLPVGFSGSEQIWANLRRLRRTAVTMRIGPPFGPLQLEPGLHGKARRQALDALGDQMMAQVAALLPPHQRGPYASAAHPPVHTAASTEPA